LFAEIKSSMELLADRDPEEARKFLDPILEQMMAAVHRYEGTASNVMADGIMALFGAPLSHEDHAVRACYAALTMESVKKYAEEVQKTEGIPVQIRVGLNRRSGDGLGGHRSIQRSVQGIDAPIKCNARKYFMFVPMSAKKPVRSVRECSSSLGLHPCRHKLGLLDLFRPHNFTLESEC